VEIDLIVRGACALRPGIEGLLGEHPGALDRRPVSRAQPDLAFRERRSRRSVARKRDWMGRNLFRRIEVAFPVLDPELKARVVNEGLKPYLADNCDAWELSGDGTYERLKVSRRSRPRAAQRWLVERLAEKPEPINR
jgi:polyphosphate kinase